MSKNAPLFFIITSSDVYRFSKFFHCHILQEIAINFSFSIPPHDHTLNALLHYLVKFWCQKARRWTRGVLTCDKAATAILHKTESLQHLLLTYFISFSVLFVTSIWFSCKLGNILMKSLWNSFQWRRWSILWSESDANPAAFAYFVLAMQLSAAVWLNDSETVHERQIDVVVRDSH